MGEAKRKEAEGGKTKLPQHHHCITPCLPSRDNTKHNRTAPNRHPRVAADYRGEPAAASSIGTSANAHQQAAETQHMPAGKQETRAESIAVVDAPQAEAIALLPGVVATEPEAKRTDESTGNANNGGDQQAAAPKVSDTDLAAQAGDVVADAAVAATEATPLHANPPAAASVTNATIHHEAPPATTHDASTQQQQTPQPELPPQQQQTEKAAESPTTNQAPAETAKASVESTAATGEKKDAAKDKAGSREPTLMDSYTELFNYASLECGAKLLAANEDAQGASNVLSESRERYTMSPCGSERWLVIELCEEVGLTAFEVANFEYFSSTFKDIQLFGSHSWPSATWVHIGNFTAQNAKKLQHFSLPETVWFKYVKVAFLTHYGSQYYCPVSVVRIHGTSHVANLKEKMISNSKEIGQRINEIKSKHKPKDPNKEASVSASPTAQPVVINDDAAVPKKDTTPKEVADLAQAGNHAAAGPAPGTHDAQAPSGTTTSAAAATAPPSSAPASTTTATTVDTSGQAAAPLVGDVSQARDSSSAGQSAVKDAPAVQDHPVATAAATLSLEPAQPQDPVRPDQQSVALDTPLPASSPAHKAPATADDSDQSATAAAITIVAPSVAVPDAPLTTTGAAVPQRPMTNVSTAQQVAQQLAGGNGEPLIMDPTRPLPSSDVDLATFTAAPSLPAATTGPAAAAGDTTAPTTAPDVVAPVAITGNTTTTTTTTAKTVTDTATAASAPTTGAGAPHAASSANAETEPEATVTVAQPNLKADEPAGEPPLLSDTTVAAAPTVAAAVLPASDSVDSTAHAPTGQVVSGPPVAAEPHAPMATDERATAAAPAAAEQPAEQEAALVVEPSPAMRVSMTRLMLEELPQLVDEDFNTQESIFTTLANRMKTLEINQHLLNAYLEGVVAKHLEAYDEVAVELDKFNNERHSIVSTLHNAVKSNALMREEHAKIMDTWRQELAEAAKSLEARLTAECRHDTQQIRAKIGHDNLEQLVLVALVAAATHLLIHIVRRCVAWCHAALRRRAIGQRASLRKKDDDHDNASARALGKPEDSEEGSESDDGTGGGGGGEAGARQRYSNGSLSDGDGGAQHRWTLVRRNRGGRQRRGTGDGKEKCERPPPSTAEDSDHPGPGGERPRDDAATRKRRRRQVHGDHETESETETENKSEIGGGEAGGDRRRSCEDSTTKRRRPDHRWSPPSSKRPAATPQQQLTLQRPTEHEQATTNSGKQPGGHANNNSKKQATTNDNRDSVGRKGGKKRSTSTDATAPHIGSRPPQKSRSFGL